MSAHRLLPLSLLLIAVACGGPTPAAPSGAGDDPPAFGTSNGPAQPGNSFVVRSNEDVLLTTVDDEKGLVVRHWNTETVPICGGTVPPGTAEVQQVFTPGGVIYVWRTGSLPVYVYRLSEVPPQQVTAQFCSDLKTKWIYRGTHVITNHDNNQFFDPGRTNAFGFNALGDLFNRAGKRFAYRESLLVVADTDTGNELNFNYTLSIR